MHKTTTVSTATKPVAHHLHELRNSLFVVLSVFMLGSLIAYGFADKLVRIIQHPINQTLFYTSPIAGFSFVMKLCCTVGAIVAIPVLMNRLINFVKPAMPHHLRYNMGWYSAASVVLAATGVVFAYFVSLPNALQFLTNFNAGADIRALITVDSYFSFVTTYLVGYALLFQTPLLMLFINRIKPLSPQQLLGSMRMVILVSFIVSAVLTPTPDPWNLFLMAVPCVMLYGIGAVLVLSKNRKSSARKSAVPAYVAPAKPQSKLLEITPKPSPSVLERAATPRPAAKSFDVIYVQEPKGSQPRLTVLQ